MRPKLRFALLSAGALIGVVVTFSLGQWQLSRAAQKEALHAAIGSQSMRPPVGLADLAAPIRADDLLHRQARLRGRWLSQNTVFLDNRQMHDQTGFYVVTPLKLAGSNTVILVQRGWVARNFLDRTALPVVISSPGEVEVQGQIAPPPSKLYAFEGAEKGPIRQNLDLADFSAETGLALLPLSVRQIGPTEGALKRDWPLANSGVQKNYGYAFQWFGLCALIVILYVWFQIVRRFISTTPKHPT